MSAKKMGLGRSFESLIPTELLDESFDPTAKQDESISDLRHIRLSEIAPDPDQPRRSFDEVSLEELAASIKEHGILQPIVVMPHKTGYMIVAGERRFRAAQIAHLDKIPALVRTLSGQHKLEISLIENLQRHDLNPLETATAYLKLRDQFNLTLDQIGDRVGGRSAAAISNTLRLLRLPEVARDALLTGKVREGQIRALIGLDTELIEAILPRIISEEWSARMVEEYAARAKKLPSAKRKQEAKRASNAVYRAEATRLEKHFGTSVRIKESSNGTGQIMISYKSKGDFDRLAKLLER